MRATALLALLAAASAFCAGQATGAAQAQRVVRAYPKVCLPGLYVSTSEVYGSGNPFIPKLASRSAVATVPAFKGRLAKDGRYDTRITSLDAEAGKLRYSVEYFDDARKQPANELQSLPLASCGG